MRAQPYLIPFFPKCDLTAGMCKWQAVLVLWSWVSLFSWKKAWQIYLKHYLCCIYTWNDQSSIYLYHVISLFSAYYIMAENWFWTLHDILYELLYFEDSLIFVDKSCMCYSKMWLQRDRDIKFTGLFGDRGHQGPYSPNKPCNHNLYWNNYLPSHR